MKVHYLFEGRIKEKNNVEFSRESVKKVLKLKLTFASIFEGDDRQTETNSRLTRK